MVVQDRKMSKKTIRNAYVLPLMVMGFGFFAIGAGSFAEEVKERTISDWSYIIPISIFHGVMAFIGLFILVRSPFLRVRVADGKVAEYSWRSKDELVVTRAWPVLSHYSLLPAWAPACRTKDGEVVVLQMVAQYGIPFTGKPARSVVKICDTINHNARVVGIFDDVPDESEEALPAVSSSDELSKD